jgi:hypothetical protein
VLFNIFPDLLAGKLSMLLNGNNPKVFSVGILIISAILSLPFSSLVTSYGLMKSFWLSSVLVLVAIAGVVGLSSPLALVLMVAIFGIGFSALSVSTLPLAISKANYYEKVYCVGIFFAGVAIPDAIVESIQAF